MTARQRRADGTSRTPSPTRGSTYRPVGRGPCAPPKNAYPAAGHMGPALQVHTPPKKQRGAPCGAPRVFRPCVAQTEEGYIRRLVRAGTAGEILVNALQVERLTGGRLPDHSGDDLRVATAIQHLHARGCLIPVRAAGERGSVQSGGVRIRIEGASVKCHIRTGCPHPAAQGKRIPTPVCALARNDSALRCSGGQSRPPLRRDAVPYETRQQKRDSLAAVSFVILASFSGLRPGRRPPPRGGWARRPRNRWSHPSRPAGRRGSHGARRRSWAPA